MAGIIGVIIVFSAVFGGYLLSGGKIGIVLKALPYEFIMIGGAASGAFLIANDTPIVRHSARDIFGAFGRPKWNKDAYCDALCLMADLLRLQKQNPLDFEQQIEDPHNSNIFARYPGILQDTDVVEFIVDTSRLSSLNFDDAHQLDELLSKRIDARLAEKLHSSHAFQILADGLPALGIVAAVLGVIKTMGAIDQPPEVLGKLIGGALVGTFLGVFLAYGLVGPLASRLKGKIERDIALYQVVRDIFVAALNKHPTNILIEVGRQSVPEELRPSFNELNEALKASKVSEQ